MWVGRGDERGTEGMAVGGHAWLILSAGALVKTSCIKLREAQKLKTRFKLEAC